MDFSEENVLLSMSRNERDDRGQYTEKVSLDDVRAFFERSEPHTAGEIADELGVTNRTALNKLDTLHEQDEIQRKKVGARAVVWYRELNPQTAAEALSEMTGRPIEEFLADEEKYPMPAPDELEWEEIEED